MNALISYRFSPLCIGVVIVYVVVVVSNVVIVIVRRCSPLLRTERDKAPIFFDVVIVDLRRHFRRPLSNFAIVFCRRYRHRHRLTPSAIIVVVLCRRHRHRL